MISILMATYNGEKYISLQLDSILRQTLTDFELIICDDCSSDNTVSIINKYQTTEPRIKLYQNKTNLGFKKNFEQLLNYCTGEYIAFCDQDDIWTDNHLEILLNALQNNLLACGNAILMNQNGDNLNITTKQCYEIPDSLNSSNALLNLMHNNFCQGTACLITRELLRICNSLPENVGFHDWWFALLAAAQNKIIYTDEPVLFYRQHDSTVTKSEKWNLKTAFKKHLTNKNLFIEKCNDRLHYIYAIEKFSNRIEIKEAKTYYENFLNSKHLKNLRYFKLNYKFIYWSNSNNKLLYLMRFIKLFILHC